MRRTLILALALALAGCSGLNEAAPVAPTADPAPFQEYLDFKTNSVRGELPDGVQFPPNPPSIPGATLCPFESWNGDTLEVTIVLDSYLGEANAIGWDMFYEGLDYVDTVALIDWAPPSGIFGGSINENPFPDPLCQCDYPPHSLARAGGFTTGEPLAPGGEPVALCVVRFVQALIWDTHELRIVHVFDDFANLPTGCEPAAD